MTRIPSIIVVTLLLVLSLTVPGSTQPLNHPGLGALAPLFGDSTDAATPPATRQPAAGTTTASPAANPSQPTPATASNEQTPAANTGTATGTSTTPATAPAPSPTSPLSLGSTQPQGEWSISLNRVFWAVVVFILAWIGFRYITRLLEFIAERRPRQRVTIKAAIPVVRIVGWTVVLYLIIARIFAPPIQTLLALTASAGIAVGFAAQDILKNIFGGIMILFDRPFSVGDKIQIGDHYGEVVNIGLRTVRIVTPDDSEVSIPNAEVAASPVSNANSGASSCQVVAEFYLTPDVDLVAVKRIATRAAAVSRYTFLNKPIAVVLKNEIHEGRSLVKVRLKAYVLDIRFEFAHISDLTQIVLEELRRQGLVDPRQLAHSLSDPS